MSLQAASAHGQMRDCVLSKPELIEEIFWQFDDQARKLFSHETCYQFNRILAGGSGDSYAAALTTEMTFEAVASLQMEASCGMKLSRYAAPWVPKADFGRTLAIGISFSGQVSRTEEFLQLAKNRSMPTLAITSNPSSKVGAAADFVFNSSISNPDIPGVRTYLASQLAMYVIALRLAEVREAIPQAKCKQLRDEIVNSGKIIAETNRRISETVRQTVKKLREKPLFLFLGSGPHFGTALFGAEKIIEATGRNAYGQDIEEWAHLERWTLERDLPTFLIAPPGLSYRRAVEVGRHIKNTGRYLIAVVNQDEEVISKFAEVTLPVFGAVPEPFSPLLYSSAVELFASDLAQEVGEPYMRNFVEPWMGQGETIIRDSETFTKSGQDKGFIDLY